MQYVTHCARGDSERAAPWAFDTVPEMPATGTEPSLLLFSSNDRTRGWSVVKSQAALDYEEPFHSTLGASGKLKKKRKKIHFSTRIHNVYVRR
jgi:hypothetical protein